MLERARSLVPRFRERAQAAEAARRLPAESIAEMVAAGLPRILVPARFGGYQLGALAWFEVVREVAKADASHGWCASLMIHQAHYVSLFPDEAQRAVWGDGPDVVVAASIVPATEVTVVEGGFRLSGKAPYTSGVSGASWVIIGGLVRDASAPPIWTWFLIAPGDYEIEDSWFTSGMRGTGSNTVITRDVFVPDYRSLAQAAIQEGATPGAKANEGTLYKAPWSAFAPLTFVTPMLGAALSAYAEFTHAVADRHATTGRSIANLDHVQVKLGRVAASLDAADLLLRRAAQALDSGAIDDYQRTLAVRDYSYSAELVVGAIDALMALGGSAGFASANPLQRTWRDIHFAATHHALNPELNLGYWGQMELGVASNPLTY
jgi:3-hydroxy-9,10-secoandrosta-1,3,5(10)-triene-9,17-dione monooxygenase